MRNRRDPWTNCDLDSICRFGPNVLQVAISMWNQWYSLVIILGSSSWAAEICKAWKSSLTVSLLTQRRCAPIQKKHGRVPECIELVWNGNIWCSRYSESLEQLQWQRGSFRLVTDASGFPGKCLSYLSRSGESQRNTRAVESKTERGTRTREILGRWNSFVFSRKPIIFHNSVHKETNAQKEVIFPFRSGCSLTVEASFGWGWRISTKVSDGCCFLGSQNRNLASWMNFKFFTVFVYLCPSKLSQRIHRIRNIYLHFPEKCIAMFHRSCR